MITQAEGDCSSLLFHWSLSTTAEYKWECPPEAIWPKDTKKFDALAVQTPFSEETKDIVIEMSDIKHEIYQLNFVICDKARVR